MSDVLAKRSLNMLENDGIIELFYHLLWVCDPMFGTSNDTFQFFSKLLQFQQFRVCSFLTRLFTNLTNQKLGILVSRT